MNIQEIGDADTWRASSKLRESAGKASPAPSLSALARRALFDADNDVGFAAELLAAELERPEVRAALSLDAVRQAAASAIASVRAYERSAVERGAGVSRILSRAATVDRCFMNWPLPGGGVLGDAGADDIRRAIDHYAVAAGTMERRAGFLRRVLDNLPNGKRVRDAITERQLEQWSAGQ